jgi:phosphatidate cytidylyltransferase
MVSIPILAVLVPAYYLFDGKIFKIILTLGLVMAFCEFASMMTFFFVYSPNNVSRFLLSTVLFLALLLSMISVCTINISLLGTAVIASVMTDIGAYFFGNLIGGRLIKSRPFPMISPKKTWEGSIIGIMIGLISVYFWTGGHFEQMWMVPVAFAGDILESLLKRWSNVKDSNDEIIQSDIPVLKQVESLLGGRNGHGGFYDRLDSLSLVLAVLFFLAP